MKKLVSHDSIIHNDTKHLAILVNNVYPSVKLNFENVQYFTNSVFRTHADY